MWKESYVGTFSIREVSYVRTSGFPTAGVFVFSTVEITKLQNLRIIL